MIKFNFKRLIKLIISIAIPQLAGFIGSLVTVPALDPWYKNLKKPFFTPPSSIFSPVWITLFFLMGIALYLVWVKEDRFKSKKTAIRVFIIQLLLNITWSLVFFGLKSLGLGLLVIILLWVAILITIKEFSEISKMAAWLLVPYILWVSYAAILNLALFILN